jgi:predicted nucleotide-binding protein with TIR-like domain
VEPTSVEALAAAYAIQENLQHDAEVTVWPQGVFSLSKTAMHSLAQALARSEFGAFVFAPDDDLTGVTPGTNDPGRKDGNLQAALGPFCNQVRLALKKWEPVHKGQNRTRTSASVKLRNVVIHSALYGAREHRLDVKKALIKEFRARGSVFVGNQLAGDPCPNVVKDLQLDSSYRGTRQKVVLPEGRSLQFPE